MHTERYRCPLSTKKGYTLAYSKLNRLRVADHVAVKHMDLMPECVVGCGSFSRTDTLKRHRNGNMGTYKRCLGCRKEFKTKEARFLHETTACPFADQKCAYKKFEEEEPGVGGKVKASLAKRKNMCKVSSKSKGGKGGKKNGATGKAGVISGV